MREIVKKKFPNDQKNDLTLLKNSNTDFIHVQNEWNYSDQKTRG